MLSDQIRADFPILTRQVHGKPLVYLDNAATTQKPQAVIDAIVHYYSHYNSNVHRGVHQLSQEATDAFEAVRTQLQGHLNAAHAHEVIFTKGSTDSLNLVAHGFRSLLHPGDEIIVSQLEHHSNLVPWHMLAERTGPSLRYIPMNGQGELDQSVYESLLNARTKVVAFNHISNALGTINPVKEMAAKAHVVGRGGGRGWGTGLAPRRGGRAGLGCGFLQRFGPQDVRPYGHWPLVRKDRMAGKIAPLPRRRRDDSGRRNDLEYLRGLAPQV